MRVVRNANLVLRFALELCALAAAGYWGSTATSGLALVIVTPAAILLVAVAWGLFVAPKARIELPRPARFAVELAVWACCALALGAAGEGELAVVFLVVAVASGTLNYVLG